MGWGIPEAGQQCYNSPMNSDLSGSSPRAKMPFLGRTLCRGPTKTPKANPPQDHSTAGWWCHEMLPMWRWTRPEGCLFLKWKWNNCLAACQGFLRAQTGLACIHLAWGRGWRDSLQISLYQFIPSTGSGLSMVNLGHWVLLLPDPTTWAKN